MPSVNLSPQTYEKLRSYAARSGKTPDSAAEQLLDSELLRSLSDEEWRVEFRRVREEVQAALPGDLSDEELDAEIAAAVQETRAGLRARRR
jgi:hypothetical protein